MLLDSICPVIRRAGKLHQTKLAMFSHLLGIRSSEVGVLLNTPV